MVCGLRTGKPDSRRGGRAGGTVFWSDINWQRGAGLFTNQLETIDLCREALARPHKFRTSFIGTANWSMTRRFVIRNLIAGASQS